MSIINKQTTKLLQIFPLYLLIYLLGGIFFFIFAKYFQFIELKKLLFIINSFLFLVSIFIFLFLIIIYFKKYFNFKKFIKQKYEFISVLLISISYVFIYLKNYHTGRFSLLNWFARNLSQKNIVGIISNFPRTYFSIISNILYLFNIRLSAHFFFYINDIFSVFFIILVYFLVNKIIKNKIISLFVLFVLFFSTPMKRVFSSLELVSLVLFFVYLSIFFIFKYITEKTKLFFYLSLFSFILASFIRFEIILFYGLPYICFLAFFLNKDKFIKKKMVIFSTLFLFLLLPVILHYSKGDKNLLGIKQNGTSSLLLVNNIFKIGYDNLIIENQLSFSNYFNSIFTYTFLFFSIIYLFILFYRIVIKKENSKKTKIIYLLIFYSLFYFIFQVFFNSQGLELVDRHTINYFPLQIIITFYFLNLFFKKLFFKFLYKKQIVNLLLILFMICFTYLLINSNYEFSYNQYWNMNLNQDSETNNYNYLLNNFKFNYSCKIISHKHFIPLLVYYYGTQNKLFFLSDFLSRNKTFNDLDGCYYLYLDNMNENKNIIPYFKNITLNLTRQCNHKTLINFNETTSKNKQDVMELIQFNC